VAGRRKDGEKMNLAEYFENNQGTGALATSNKGGIVDVAVYSKPHVLGRNKVAFVMRKRLSRRNLKSNPRAAYMYTLKGKATDGIRLYLEMTGEERDPNIVLSMRRRKTPLAQGEELYLVYFKVTRVRALVGDQEYALT
jgi:hypothetical protein